MYDPVTNVRRVCWRQKTFNFEMNCLVMLESCSFSAAGEKFFVSLRVAGAGSRGGCLNYAMLCVDVAPQYLWNLWLAPCTRSSDGMEGHTHSCVLVAQNSFLVCKFTCEKYTFANKRKNKCTRRSVLPPPIILNFQEGNNLKSLKKLILVVGTLNWTRLSY